MCFSPEADLVAGVVIGVVAVDAIARRPARRNWLLASLPALLAVHTLVESLVWFGGRGQVSESLGTAATYVYAVIAFAVLPVLVPLAVLAREREPRRRRLLVLGSCLGILVSAIMLWSVLVGPLTTTLHAYAISYEIDIPAPTVLVPLYVVATCGAALLSSSRHIVVFGVVNLLVVLLLGWRSVQGLASLWCIWAALTSVAIALLVRRDEGQRTVTSS
ncbi:hypothetical protein O9K63_01105 [Janibacter cremeus]|uniref:DUF6629 family protein n=1 Tax=Janibacter cremeus TaxID=1285192 RepID=UPI0023F7E360|nr:DUF6629 family protein [Janibacter cremeus]WEV78422.1 hypothetical protein O9K63_01105 [Janibacter cremeus]